jgi:glyceraldehyde-3-phosphate dehydrogenase/erythrose-4-phosphate dehydrogenase
LRHSLQAVGKVIPELNGKLTGMAFRVPTPGDNKLKTVTLYASYRIIPFVIAVNEHSERAITY